MSALIQITPKQYKELLDNFDWNYHYSDDHSVYMKGVKKSKELFEMTKENPEFKKLYNKIAK